MEMKKYKLGDLIDVSRGKSLAGEFYATSGDLVRLTMGNFDYINNCFKQNTSKDNLFFSGKVEEKFILNAGDIITPLTEQTPGLLGSTARIPESGKYIQSQDVALVRCKKDKLDDGFAYYLISSESVKKQLGAAAQQTKIRHTSPDKIKDCTVYIPEISIQKKIGNILSTLDKRIENLRAQNRVLEQTAKTIYDYTFLQCAGHQTTYNKTLNRNIPTNWEVKKLGEIADFKNGINYDPSKPGNKKTKIVNVRNVSSSTYFISESDLDDLFVDEKHAAKYYVSQDDILITRSGTPGAARMIAPSKEPVVYCGFIIKMTFDDKKMKNYLFFKMKELEAAIQKQSAGSILSNISQDVLNNLEIAIPDEKTLNNFNAQIMPLLKKQLVNTKQIETLTTQRNTLLPLLMTGQVEV